MLPNSCIKDIWHGPYLLSWRIVFFTSTLKYCLYYNVFAWPDKVVLYPLLLKFTSAQIALQANVKSPNNDLKKKIDVIYFIASTNLFPERHSWYSTGHTDAPWEGNVTSAFRDTSYLSYMILQYSHTTHVLYGIRLICYLKKKKVFPEISLFF